MSAQQALFFRRRFESKRTHGGLTHIFFVLGEYDFLQLFTCFDIIALAIRQCAE